MAVDRELFRLTLFLLVATNVLDARKCNIACTGTPGTLNNLENGKTYQYKLEGSSITTLPGAKNDVSKMDITANVEISATKCDHFITLTGVQTKGTDGKSHDLMSKLGSHSVKFGMQNGKINDLCVDEEEKTPALNIKRAVLSLLQTSLIKESGSGHLHEVDVFGSCPTSFHFSKSGNGITVKKSRDLNKCAYREGFNAPFPTAAYYTTSDLHTANLMNGILNVEQKLEGGVLKSAKAEETYEYNPLSVAEPYAKIKIITKLTLVGQTTKPPVSVKGAEGKTLIFEPEHQQELGGNIDQIFNNLEKACESRVVGKDGAKHFNSLIYAISGANIADLNTVWNRIKSGGVKNQKTAKDLFLDAIASSYTSNSVEMISNLITSGDIVGTDVKVALARIGWVKHVSPKALESTLNIFKKPELLSSSSYLGLGALGGKYCSEHKCSGPLVDKFQEKLAGPLLKNGCKIIGDKKTEDLVIASLKGLGNMRHLSDDLAKKLIECTLGHSIKARMKSAILDTLKTDPHKPGVKEAAGTLFLDVRNDAEIRIKAYLILVECPCGKVASWIKEVLSSDKSFQVNSFVISHLRNIRASTSPFKAAARHHLGSIITNSKIPLDFRKFSQNYELSYSLDLLNLGASAESNLIYSQNSYIPRSVSFNLTTQLFGRAFNWMQLDARVESAEKTLERIFGPRGYLKTHETNEIIDEGKSLLNSVLEKVATKYDQAVRPKRSPRLITRDQIDALAKKVNLKSENDDDLDLDLSLRIFGNEMTWLKFHGRDTDFDADAAIDEVFGKLDQTINSARNIDRDYRKQFSFANRELAYPTAMGLPIRLKLLGSTALRLKFDGKVDIPAIIKDPQNTDIKFQFVPSAAVDLSLDMNIDGVAVETGVRVNMDIHTSTGSDITIRVLDGKGLDVKIGLPIKKQELLNLKTEIHSVVREDAKSESLIPVAFNVKRENYEGCFDQMSEIIGLTFCGEVSVPWEGQRSVAPAYGPIKISAHIDKEDDSLNTYHFRVLHTDGEDKTNFELILDTPNSKTNRKLSLHVEGTTRNKPYLNVNLQSPWTHAKFEGSIYDTPTDKGIAIQVNHDDAQYNLKLGAKTSKVGPSIKYEPVLEYKAPEFKANLIGRRGGAKQPQQSYSLSGAVLVTPEGDGSEKWNMEKLALHTPRNVYVLDGSGTTGKGLLTGDVKLSLEDNQNVLMKWKIKNTPEPSVWINVVPSQYPDFGFDLKWDGYLRQKSPEKIAIESKFILVHGPDPKSELSRIYVHDIYERDTKAGILTVENEISYPVLNVMAHEVFKITPKSLTLVLKGKLDKYSGQIKGKGTINQKKSGTEYNAEGLVELMGNSITVNSARKVLKNSQAKYTNSIELKPGSKYELNFLVTNKEEEKGYDYRFDAELKLPSEPKLLKVDASWRTHNLNFKAHLKALAGEKQYVDAVIDLVNEGETHNQRLKLKLPGYIEAQADFKTGPSSTTGKGVVFLPRVDKKMELKCDLKTSSTSVKGNVDFCWDTKDPSKSIKLETDNEINRQIDHYTTKNTLTYMDKKMQLNGVFKQSLLEEFNGPIVRELELVLPCGHKLSVSSTGTVDTTKEDVFIGNIITKIISRPPGQEPYVLTITTEAHPFDFDKDILKGKLVINYLDQDKKDLEGHLLFEILPKDEKVSVKADLQTSGSLIDRPLRLKVETELADELFDGDVLTQKAGVPLVTYRLISTSGPDIQLELSGKLGDNTVAAELSAKLPDNYEVKSVKWSTFNSLETKDGKNKLKVFNGLSWNGDKFIKTKLDAGYEDNGINYAAEWETHSISNRKLTGAAHWSEEDPIKADASAALVWEGKSADLSIKFDVSSDNNLYSLHILGNTPEQGKTDLLLKHKVISERKGMHTDLSVTTKEKKIILSSKIELDENHPLLDINVDHPDGKSRFLYKTDRKTEKHWVTEVKVKWTGENGGSLTMDQEVNLQAIDNFFIKSNMDAPTLNIKKFHLDISGKPGKGESNKLSFSMKTEDKVVIAGNANYIVKEEGDSISIEGNGNVKREDKTYPLTISGHYKRLDEGRKAKLNIKVGDASLALQHEQTPTSFVIERIFCKDKSSCTKARIANKVDLIDEREHVHTVDFIIDFSTISPKLNDISYQEKMKRNGLVVDHNVELKWAPTEGIKYHGYILPKQAGVTIALPKRTIGTEVKYDWTAKGDTAGSMKFETDIWLDKLKGQKLCIIAVTNVVRSKESTSITGETKITHPSLKKDLSIKGKTVIGDKLGKLIEGDIIVDVFKNPNQKIVINFKSSGTLEKKAYTGHSILTIKSDACKLNIGIERRLELNPEDFIFSWLESAHYVDSKGAKREGLIKGVLNSKHVYGMVKIPEATIFELDAVIHKSDKKVIEERSKLNFLGKIYQENWSYNIDTNHLKYVLNFDGKTLESEAGAEMGKNGRLVVLFDKKEAGKLEVALDEPNFLKSKYTYNTDTIKAILHALIDSVSGVQKEAERIASHSLNNLKSETELMLKCIADCAPDFSKAREQLKTELNAIKDEIVNDESISKFGQNLKEAFGSIFEQFTVIGDEFTKFLATITNLIEESIKKGITLWNEICPKVTESLDKFTKVVFSILEEVLQLSKKIGDAILEEIKKHEADIQDYLNISTEFIHEIGKQFSKVILSIHEEVSKLVELTVEQLKELPFIAMIEEKIKEAKEWKVPEDIWNVYTELIESLKQILPTPECEEFLTALSHYITKIANQEEFDKEEASRQLYAKFDAAIRSLAAKISEIAPKKDALKPGKYLQVPMANWLKIPRGGIRLSILNWILQNDVRSPVEILSNIHLSLNPLDNIPPFKGEGLILEGSEIITFDGRHLGFKGSCDYVIAEDYVERNFSVIAHVTAGKLEAITLSDAKDSVTVSPGIPIANGKECEYPIHAGILRGWSRPDSIGAHSEAGVTVLCSRAFDYCQVSVSGFYFNKVRGLLGNLNYEQYDDLLLPSGDLATDDSKFGNSWKLTESCTDVPSVPHSHARDPLCSKFFANDYAVLLGTPWANPSPFRAACDHAVAEAPAEQKLDTACRIIQGYIYIARQKGGIFLEIPDDCVVCNINGKKVGEYDDVKTTPKDAADVVFIVEAEDENKENYNSVAVPLISSLKKKLAAIGINDVRISIVSYNPFSKWPFYYTSKGNLYDVQNPKIDFPRDTDEIQTLGGKIETGLEEINNELGNVPMDRAYKDVFEHYNFRPNAYRGIVGVHAYCSSSKTAVLKGIIGTVVARVKGIVYNVISPVRDFKVQAVKPNEVVGFDDDNLLTVSGETPGEPDYIFDACIEAAHIAGGYAFPVDNLRGKADFIDKAAESIATSIKQKDMELECDCTAVNGVLPRPRCLMEDID